LKGKTRTVTAGGACATMRSCLMLSDLFLLETSTCTQWMIESMALAGRRVKKKARDRYMAFTPGRGVAGIEDRND
jgi:hypothetical protein